MSTVAYPASTKQFAFIKKLVAERELDLVATSFLNVCRTSAIEGTLDSRAASSLIDMLLAQPKASSAAPVDVSAGVYRHEGQLFRVYLGQQSGKMLVKSIEINGSEASYEYLGSAARFLPAQAVRLPLEEVGSLGIATGQCMICSRRLDDPESVDRGIGPVCASRY